MKIIDPLTDIMPFSIQFYDRGFKVLDLNQAAVKLFRLKSKAEGIGRLLEALNPGFAASERPAIYEKVLQSGEPAILKAVLLNLEPPGHHGVYAFRYKPDILCICTFDVSRWVVDERQRIQELEDKNQQLEQFSYTASHDLQEPLRTLTSFVDLLEEDTTSTLSGEGKEFIRFIRSSTSRMQTLIKDLLEYSRAGQWNPREVDTNQIFQDVLQDLVAEVAASKAVVTSTPLPSIFFDPTQLKQVFQNLLSNSLKFRVDERPTKIAVGAKAIPSGWEFRMEDNGIGIDSQYHEKVFRMFQRLHSRSKYEGSGIGLSLCKRIINSSGGDLRIESTPGLGTTVFFTVLAQR